MFKQAISTPLIQPTDCFWPQCFFANHCPKLASKGFCLGLAGLQKLKPVLAFRIPEQLLPGLYPKVERVRVAYAPNHSRIGANQNTIGAFNQLRQGLRNAFPVIADMALKPCPRGHSLAKVNNMRNVSRACVPQGSTMPGGKLTLPLFGGPAAAGVVTAPNECLSPVCAAVAALVVA